MLKKQRVWGKVGDKAEVAVVLHWDVKCTRVCSHVECVLPLGSVIVDIRRGFILPSCAGLYETDSLPESGSRSGGGWMRSIGLQITLSGVLWWWSFIGNNGWRRVHLWSPFEGALMLQRLYGLVTSTATSSPSIALGLLENKNCHAQTIKINRHFLFVYTSVQTTLRWMMIVRYDFTSNKTRMKVLTLCRSTKGSCTGYGIA